MKNTLQEEVDLLAWTTAVPSGSTWQRTVDGNMVGEWHLAPYRALPANQLEERWYEPEPVILPPLPPIWISEILPNLEGVDDGREFIELYNNGDAVVDLSGLILQVGESSLKEVLIPEGTIIQPRSYLALSNSALSFSLVNTTGRVSLLAVGGTMIHQTDVYDTPKEDHAWAWLDGAWRYSDQPTPGVVNLPSQVLGPSPTLTETAPVPVVEPLVQLASASVPNTVVPSRKPCAANQYRHPETNRCRLLKTNTTSTTPIPCPAHQYRSVATNRCRNNVATTTKPPAPCKEGQERNSATNRCRVIKAMPAATDHAVLGTETENQPDQWYIIYAVAIAALLVASYAAWEWRQELAQFARQAWRFVHRSK